MPNQSEPESEGEWSMEKIPKYDSMQTVNIIGKVEIARLTIVLEELDRIMKSVAVCNSRGWGGVQLPALGRGSLACSEECRILDGSRIPQGS